MIVRCPSAGGDDGFLVKDRRPIALSSHRTNENKSVLLYGEVKAKHTTSINTQELRSQREKKKKKRNSTKKEGLVHIKDISERREREREKVSNSLSLWGLLFEKRP